MTKNGSCINFHIVLTALSPVHIGSGQEIMKRNYLYDSSDNSVTFYNMDKLFGLIAKYGKVDEYERYMLSANDRSDATLERFISSCELTRSHFREAELYSVNAADALDSKHSLSSIQKFVRLADSRPYIPGSSLKGALRTVILHSLIREGQYTEKDLKDWRGKDSSELVESKLLDKLDLKDKKDRLVSAQCRSIMRGLMISDSAPISNSDIILAKKLDIYVDDEKQTPNVIRECVRPGTRLRFAVTIDTSLMTMTPEKLLSDIKACFAYYRDTYLSKFDSGERTLPDNSGCCIVLGGGSGYFSKNIAYKALGREKGLEFVSEYMRSKFKGHYHGSDADDGISPHMLKCTEYIGKELQFGVCGVEVE